MNKYSIIAAMCQNRGIGYRGGLPWRNLADMLFFKSKTRGSVVIMGRKTWETLPKPLNDRTNVVISRTKQNKNCYTSHSLRHALRTFGGGSRPVFVIGGQQLYEEAINDAEKIYLSKIDKEYECDTFFPEIPGHFKLIDSYPAFPSITNTMPIVNEYENFSAREPNCESAYLQLLRDVIIKGEYKQNRTGVPTYSLCNQMIKFNIDYIVPDVPDLNQEHQKRCDYYTLPVLTTKKVFLKGVVNELLWFLNGCRNVVFIFGMAIRRQNT